MRSTARHPARWAALALAAALVLPALAPPALAQSPAALDFVWTGAITPTTVRVTGGFVGEPGVFRLAVVTEEAHAESGFEGATYTDARTIDAEAGTIGFPVEGLEPGTRYRYAVEVDDVLAIGLTGRFRTPEDRPFSFRVAMGGCAETGSDRPVFDVIRRQRPLFFLHLGDLHYEDISAPDPAAYRAAYREVLASPAQARLFRSTPVVYMWDDHDYGPNNSDMRAPGRDDARRAYQDIVPHYPLGLGEGDVPLAQAFTVGRVRFIVTDLRSNREPRQPWRPYPSMMGADQKAWFLDQLLQAKDEAALTVWVSTVPWIDDPDPTDDTWGGYARERREIADFIVENGIENLVVLGGDAHMIAMDDGSNSNYSSQPGDAFPVIQAAALDRPGSRKGGPYSEGAFPNPSVIPPHDGQWVLMEVEDDGGGEVCASWRGLRTKWNRPSTRPVVRYERCFETEPAPVAEEEAGEAAEEGRAVPTPEAAGGGDGRPRPPRIERVRPAAPADSTAPTDTSSTPRSRRR